MKKTAGFFAAENLKNPLMGKIKMRVKRVLNYIHTKSTLM